MNVGKLICNSVLICLLAACLSGCMMLGFGHDDWYDGPKEFRQTIKNGIRNAEAVTGKPVDIDSLYIRVKMLTPTIIIGGVPCGPSPGRPGAYCQGYVRGTVGGTVFHIYMYNSRVPMFYHECGHVVLYVHGIDGHPPEYKGRFEYWWGAE